MKAVGLFEFGGPEVLRVVELPDPPIGPEDVLIRVHAAAVNPTDALIRSGARFRGQGEVGPPPFVPGMDAAGVVAAIGLNAPTELQVGDRVMALVVPVGRHGAYSQLISVPSRSVVRAPRDTSHAEAATVPMNGATARLALDTLQLFSGQTVAISGAAGTLGNYAIQLAKADSLRVIADAAPADEGLVSGLGADVVVARGEHFAEEVRAQMGEGADGAIDCALLLDKMSGAVRDGGTVVTVRGFDKPAERGVKFAPISVRTRQCDTAMLDRLRQQVEDGALTPRVAATFPMERAADAHRLLEAGGVRGRLVLEF